MPGDRHDPNERRPVAWQIALSITAMICTLMICLTAILCTIIIFW